MPFNLVQLTETPTINRTNNVVVIEGGLVPRGGYNPATSYSVGDFISYSGSSYVMYVGAPAGTAPTDSSKWMVVAQGA